MNLIYIVLSLTISIELRNFPIFMQLVFLSIKEIFGTTMR